MNEAQVRQYLEDYAVHFDLVRYVRFGHKVTAVAPSKSGGWEVTFASNSTAGDGSAEKAQETTVVYDKCIVASGMFGTPFFPPPEKVRGITDAVETGWATHSGAYRDPEHLSGKSVLVVGCSFSGAEIASGEGYQIFFVTYSVPGTLFCPSVVGVDRKCDLPVMAFVLLLHVRQREASWETMRRQREAVHCLSLIHI